MSIQTELTRIINAKAAIKTAVEGKGVTVPDGTLLDGMAALIEAIEAGGGGEQLYCGSFTPAENTFFFRVDCEATSAGSNVLLYPKMAIVCDSDLTTISHTGNANNQVCGAGVQINTEGINFSAMFSFKGTAVATWGVHTVEEQDVSRAINGYLFFQANEKLNSYVKGYIAGRTYYYCAII